MLFVIISAFFGFFLGVGLVYTARWWLMIVVPLYVMTIPIVFVLNIIWVVVGLTGHLLFFWHPTIPATLSAFGQKVSGWDWDYFMMILTTPYYILQFGLDVFNLLIFSKPANGFYWLTFLN